MGLGSIKGMLFYWVAKAGMSESAEKRLLQVATELMKLETRVLFIADSIGAIKKGIMEDLVREEEELQSIVIDKNDQQSPVALTREESCCPAMPKPAFEINPDTLRVPIPTMAECMAINKDDAVDVD